MENNQLTKKEDNLLKKFQNYFKNLLYNFKNKKNKIYSNENKIKVCDTEERKTIKNKTEFMVLYNRMKKGEVLISSIDEECLNKMCKLMEEEIKLTQEQIEIYKSQLKKAT